MFRYKQYVVVFFMIASTFIATSALAVPTCWCCSRDGCHGFSPCPEPLPPGCYTSQFKCVVRCNIEFTNELNDMAELVTYAPDFDKIGDVPVPIPSNEECLSSGESKSDNRESPSDSNHDEAVRWILLMWMTMTP